MKKNVPNALAMSVKTKKLNYFNINADPFRDINDSTANFFIEYLSFLKDKGNYHEKIVSNLSSQILFKVMKLNKLNVEPLFELFIQD